MKRDVQQSADPKSPGFYIRTMDKLCDDALAAGRCGRSPTKVKTECGRV
jgi:hypothetical protein